MENLNSSPQNHTKDPSPAGNGHARQSNFRRIARRSKPTLLLHPRDGSVFKVAKKSGIRKEIRAISNIIVKSKHTSIAAGLLQSPALQRPSCQITALEGGFRAVGLTLPHIPTWDTTDSLHLRNCPRIDLEDASEEDSTVGLKMSRIPSLPPVVSGQILQEWYQPDQLEDIQARMKKDDGSLLMKPLFGMTARAAESDDVEAPLTSFPGDLSLLNIMFTKEFLDKIACEMALFLAYLHWGARTRYDGAGIDFLLGGCTEPGQDSILLLYCVGFSKCLELIQWSEHEVKKVMVPAVLDNYAYIPQPGTPRWEAWEETYLEMSHVFLAKRSCWRDDEGRHLYHFDLRKAMELPHLFIQQLEKELRERPERQNGDSANAVDEDSISLDSKLQGFSERGDASTDNQDAAPRDDEDPEEARGPCVRISDPDLTPTPAIITQWMHCWDQHRKFREQLRDSIAKEMRARASNTTLGVEDILPSFSIFDGTNEFFSVERAGLHTHYRVRPWGHENTRIVKAGPVSEIDEQRKKAHILLPWQSLATSLLNHHLPDISPVRIPRYHEQVTTSDSLWSMGTTLFGMPTKAHSTTEEPSIDRDNINAAGVIFEYPKCHDVLVRESLVHNCYRKDNSLQKAVLDSPRNKACLLKPLLGDDTVLADQLFDATMPLVNFPVNPRLMATVWRIHGCKYSLKASQSMGATYAIIHWWLYLDGHGVTFLLDGDQNLNVLGMEECASLPQVEATPALVKDTLVPRTLEAVAQLPRPDDSAWAAARDPRAGLFEAFAHTYKEASELLLRNPRNPIFGRFSQERKERLCGCAQYFIQRLEETLRRFYAEMETK